MSRGEEWTLSVQIVCSSFACGGGGKDVSATPSASSDCLSVVIRMESDIFNDDLYLFLQDHYNSWIGYLILRVYLHLNKQCLQICSVLPHSTAETGPSPKPKALTIYRVWSTIKHRRSLSPKLTYLEYPQNVPALRWCAPNFVSGCWTNLDQKILAGIRDAKTWQFPEQRCIDFCRIKFFN